MLRNSTAIHSPDRQNDTVEHVLLSSHDSSSGPQGNEVVEVVVEVVEVVVDVVEVIELVVELVVDVLVEVVDVLVEVVDVLAEVVEVLVEVVVVEVEVVIVVVVVIELVATGRHSVTKQASVLVLVNVPVTSSSTH